MVIEKISEILSIAEKNIPKSLMPDQPISKYSNQPEWYGFEHIIWRSGDDIRLLLSENKNSQLSESQVRRIIDISTDEDAPIKSVRNIISFDKL